MKHNRGVTLIELLIAVVIVAILVRVALPSYQSYVMRAKRSGAISAVLDLATREARYFTANNAYSASLVTLGYASDPMPVPSGGTTDYQLSVTTSNNNTNFSISATPQGGQASDACGTFTYTDVGVRGVSASTVANCWRQ